MKASYGVRGNWSLTMIVRSLAASLALIAGVLWATPQGYAQQIKLDRAAPQSKALPGLDWKKKKKPKADHPDFDWKKKKGQRRAKPTSK